MKQIDVIDEYVRGRLDAWGHEFALHRDCEILGHRSKDMLQILIEHKGQMPPRATGFKPLTIPTFVMEIEDIVRHIGLRVMTRAIVLRAYYCGSGRRGIERVEIANELLRAAQLPRIHRRTYFHEHGIGFTEVREAMFPKRRAA
jgi:hypothetical protein